MRPRGEEHEIGHPRTSETRTGIESRHGGEHHQDLGYCIPVPSALFVRNVTWLYAPWREPTVVENDIVAWCHHFVAFLWKEIPFGPVRLEVEYGPLGILWEV